MYITRGVIHKRDINHSRGREIRESGNLEKAKGQDPTPRGMVSLGLEHGVPSTLTGVWGLVLVDRKLRGYDSFPQEIPSQQREMTRGNV